MAKKKAGIEAEVNLALKNRLYLLEVIKAAGELIKVPMISAFIWFYLSRTHATLGTLNKAILAAELTPLIGDIKFPEGVLLGAAMESTEDFLKILEKADVIPSAEEVKEAALEGTEKAGAVVADFVLAAYSDGAIQNASCSALEDAMFEAREVWTKEGRLSPAGAGAIVRHGLYLISAKRNGCDRPSFVSEAAWLKA